MQQRKIIHIDMDAFYAAIEQRDHPEFRGKPVAVGGTVAQRGVLCTASYEARRFGLRSAMSSYRALQLCPDLILLSPRFQVYKQVSEQIRAIFKDYTDLIEPLSLDEAYLDVSENKKNMPSATWIAREIKQRIWEETELTASAGISYNKFLAKTASDFLKPDGLCLITPEQAQPFVDELPVGRFYGIGRKTEPKLKAMGIHTGKELSALSLSQMEVLFGRSASFYYGLARGCDERPVETDWVRKSVGSENTFPQDLGPEDDWLAALEPLAVDVLGWMDRHQTYGRTLTLKVKYSDFQQVTRSRTVRSALKTLPSLLELAQELLRQTEVGVRKVRLLGLSLSNLTNLDGEFAPAKPIKASTEGEQLRLVLE